jgi:hypothetical protein
MGAHVLLPLAVNSQSEQIVDVLPPLGLEIATFGSQAHLSDCEAESHPKIIILSSGTVFFFHLHL